MGIDPITAGIGASVIGGVAQGSASSKAAKAQQQAAQQDLAFQTQTRDIIRGDLAPYRDQGTNALGAYNYLLGLGPQPTFGAAAPQITEVPGAAQGPAYGAPRGPYSGRDMAFAMPGDPRFNPSAMARPQAAPSQFRVGDQTFGSRAEAEAYANAHKTGGTAYGGFQASPGYQFAFNQGTDAVNALAGARGGLDSGATRQALTTFGQGIANQEFGNYLTRLGGLIDTGMGAANMSGNASQNAAAGVSNALSGIGNAKAAGAVGVGNAINGGLQNMLGTYQYQNMLDKGFTPYGWSKTS